MLCSTLCYFLNRDFTTGSQTSKSYLNISVSLVRKVYVLVWSWINFTESSCFIMQWESKHKFGYKRIWNSNWTWSFSEKLLPLSEESACHNFLNKLNGTEQTSRNIFLMHLKQRKYMKKLALSDPIESGKWGITCWAVHLLPTLSQKQMGYS